jgi:CheY-like chemotaxis protein
VFMTAGSSARRWAAQLGADAYLSKPFELASLVDVTKRFATATNN